MNSVTDQFLIDLHLNTIIANAESVSTQLTAIDKKFKGHMFRQTLLENEIQQTLSSLTTHRTTKDGNG